MKVIDLNPLGRKKKIFHHRRSPERVKIKIRRVMCKPNPDIDEYVKMLMEKAYEMCIEDMSKNLNKKSV